MRIGFILSLAVVLGQASLAQAEGTVTTSSAPASSSSSKAKRPASDSAQFFSKDFLRGADILNGTVSLDLQSEAVNTAASSSSAVSSSSSSSSSSSVSADATSDVKPGDPVQEAKLLEATRVRAILDMRQCILKGDEACKKEAADRYVAYMKQLMFLVREITTAILEAYNRAESTDEEDKVGSTQLGEYLAAQASMDTMGKALIDKDDVLKRVNADPENMAHVFFFFDLSSNFARNMAPDVERLWRALKHDRRVKMVALVTKPTPRAWIDSFREYTGMTVDIYEGEKYAKAFGIALSPSLVIVAPSSSTVYLKAGQTTFESMYELVRAVQGLDRKLTPELQKLKSIPIGFVEQQKAGANSKNGQGQFSPLDTRSDSGEKF